MFQSTAGPMTGCNAAADAGVLFDSEFQSTAGPMTGCNYLAGPAAMGSPVSIHSRPHDRLQLDRPAPDPSPGSRFNPQPAP